MVSGKDFLLILRRHIAFFCNNIWNTSSQSSMAHIGAWHETELKSL